MHVSSVRWSQNPKKIMENDSKLPFSRKIMFLSQVSLSTHLIKTYFYLQTGLQKKHLHSVSSSEVAGCHKDNAPKYVKINYKCIRYMAYALDRIWWFNWNAVTELMQKYSWIFWFKSNSNMLSDWNTFLARHCSTMNPDRISKFLDLQNEGMRVKSEK